MRDYAGILPDLLDLDLLQAGWNGVVSPYPGMSERTVVFQSIRRSFLKKWETTNPSAEAAALELFKKCNSNCKDFAVDTSSFSEHHAIALGEAKDFIYRFFFQDFDSGEMLHTPLLNPASIADGFGIGNGANIGAPGTDFVSKFGLSSLSTTNLDLYKFYVQGIANSDLWSDVESIRLVNRGVSLVPGSRLSFVPKNTDISRTICTEPLLNMIFQKGIASCMERRLERVSGIDLKRQQSYNRELCRIGSETGRFGTIDLSSASDTIALSLVKELLPRQAFYWLDLARSPNTTLPGGETVELHMVSSMGNAFTFPLQTLVFTSLVYAAYRVLGIPFRKPDYRQVGNFAVNGDDIIVVREAYDLVCDLLCRCGFSVNVDKSFNTGLFRESCGCDYYHGLDVRGVYIKNLTTSNDVYSAINRLNVWSAKHGVILTNTVQYLLKGCRFLPVPPDEMDDVGIKIPYTLLKRRFRRKADGAVQYRASCPTVRGYDLTDVESRPPKRMKGWFNNPSVVLMAAVAGSLRLGRVVPRVQRPSANLRTRYTPCWDYIPPARHNNAGFVESWKTFVEVNLTN
jgi:hypothetical protein